MIFNTIPATPAREEEPASPQLSSVILCLDDVSFHNLLSADVT